MVFYELVVRRFAEIGGKVLEVRSEREAAVGIDLI